MAAYTPRRGPNVSQYIQDLNRLVPSTGALSDDAILSNDLDFSIFTNTDFLDFDMGGEGESVVARDGEPKYDMEQETRARRENANRANFNSSLKFQNFDFLDSGYGNLNEFPSILQTDEFQNLQDTLLPQVDPAFAASQQVDPLPVTVGVEPSKKKISPSAESLATLSKKKRKLSSTASPPTGNSASPPTTTGAGPTSAHSSATASVLAEDSELGRLAQEEDKRKRNTAASARFRHKKKLREQAIETENRQMKDRITELENERQQLRLENRWLKDLLTSRNESKEEKKKDELEAAVGKRGSPVLAPAKS